MAQLKLLNGRDPGINAAVGLLEAFSGSVSEHDPKERLQLKYVLTCGGMLSTYSFASNIVLPSSLVKLFDQVHLVDK